MSRDGVDPGPEGTDPDDAAGRAERTAARGGTASAAPGEQERKATDASAAATGDADVPAGDDPGLESGSEPVAPDDPRRLDPRIRLVWIGRAALVALVLGTVTMVVERLVVPVSPLVGPAVFAVLFLTGTVLAVLRYRAWCYRLRPDSLYLERGVVTQVRTVVPYVRVQHVDTRRGPVERATGLATVVVYTAGSRGADVTIPGLTPERADQLQSRLKRLAIVAEGEDAV